MSNVNPKLISEDMFLESKNIYFGTLTLVKISALFKREDIPSLVESLKKEKINCPEKR